MSMSEIKSFQFPKVRNTFSALTAQDLVSVQPMTGPTGLSYALRFNFEKERQKIYKDLGRRNAFRYILMNGKMDSCDKLPKKVRYLMISYEYDNAEYIDCFRILPNGHVFFANDNDAKVKMQSNEIKKLMIKMELKK